MDGKDSFFAIHFFIYVIKILSKKASVFSYNNRTISDVASSTLTVATDFVI